MEWWPGIVSLCPPLPLLSLLLTSLLPQMMIRIVALVAYHFTISFIFPTILCERWLTSPPVFTAEKLRFRAVVWGHMASKHVNQDSNLDLSDFRAHALNHCVILPPKSSNSTLEKCLFKRAEEERRPMDYLNITFTLICCVTLGKSCYFSSFLIYKIQMTWPMISKI